MPSALSLSELSRRICTMLLLAADSSRGFRCCDSKCCQVGVETICEEEAPQAFDGCRCCCRPSVALDDDVTGRVNRAAWFLSSRVKRKVRARRPHTSMGGHLVDVGVSL